MSRPHRKIYEQYYGITIPKFMEIHHIDGNHANNDINNLKLVSWQEHYEIHYAQGDWAACLLISGRHSIPPEERSRLASLAASKANSEGKCGFKLGHASEAGKKGGVKGGKYAKENKTGIFALTPEQNKQRHFNSVVSRLIKNGKACAWPNKENK